MRQKRVIIGLLLLLLIVSAASVSVVLSRKSPKTKGAEVTLATFTHPSTQTTFQYPKASLSAQSLSAQDEKDKIIFRATEVDKQTPFLVTLRYETGLRIAANLARMKTIDLVVDGANKSLPGRFPAYHKLRERRFQQDGKEAAEIIFEYEGPAGKKIRQRLLLLAKDGDSAFYLAGQAQASDYKVVNDIHLDSLFTSFSLSPSNDKN